MKEMVSIIMTAYNHEKWIEKAIKGVIEQETEYIFRLYIHEDNSTDKTRTIIKRYEKKFPNLIKAIYSDENQYSRGIDPFSQILLPITKGNYIMICEGDDYWIDKYKIQKQVTYMRDNSDCKLCFSNAIRVDVDGKLLKPFFPERRWRDKKVYRKLVHKKDACFTTEEMILLDFIPTASICILREGAFAALEFSYYCDLTIRLVNASLGQYSYYFNEIFTAYRTGNSQSASGSLRHSKEKLMNGFYKPHRKILEEFDELTNFRYHETIQHEIERKYLTVFLNTDFKNAIYIKRFWELPIEKIVKEIGRNYFISLFIILKKIKYGNSKITKYI